METITIPSPTAFLSSPVVPPAKLSAPTKAAPQRKTNSNKPSTASKTDAKPADGIPKPKQSKSRNGCITCKAKRLKCDETKPSCQQCHKRNVTCGGYKKDFKWRPFEEATFVNKAAATAPSRTKRNGSGDGDALGGGSTTEKKSVTQTQPIPKSRTPSTSDGSNTGLDAVDQTTAPTNVYSATAQSPSLSVMSFPSFDQDFKTPSPYLPHRTISQAYGPNSVTAPLETLFEDGNSNLSPSSGRSSSGQSPRLIDLLLPGSHLNALHPLQEAPRQEAPQQDYKQPSNQQFDSFQHALDTDVFQEEEYDEEVVRSPTTEFLQPWLTSPIQSHSQSHSHPRSLSTSSHHSDTSPFNASDFTRLYLHPTVQAGSPEMLMLRFDKQTCGILSLKDGPTENPWRTLIWPLARDSPALYHAIASMTAFHTSREKPALRVDGMEHMRRSIRALATGIERMRTETALATTLVLAFSESWDQHVSTGIEHLRGARILVAQALKKHVESPCEGEELRRLRFLVNTWVYMDVIARLTSGEGEEGVDFEEILTPLRRRGSDESSPSSSSEEEDGRLRFDYKPSPYHHHLPSPRLSSLGLQPSTTDIDPLMGCATTLFPLLGATATLVSSIRALPGPPSSPLPLSTISRAQQLQTALLNWSPSPPANSPYQKPEDPTSEVSHSLQTAEAYRYATLLYLHTAVPALPFPRASGVSVSAFLAHKTLSLLATVPLSSRVSIIHIWPLMSAGCEVWSKGDREWVKERWDGMVRRMGIGNVVRCGEVAGEVWLRRDAWAMEQRRKKMERETAQCSLRCGKRRTGGGVTVTQHPLEGQMGGNGNGTGAKRKFSSTMDYGLATSARPSLLSKQPKVVGTEFGFGSKSNPLDYAYRAYEPRNSNSDYEADLDFGDVEFAVAETLEEDVDGVLSYAQMLSGLGAGSLKRARGGSGSLGDVDVRRRHNDSCENRGERRRSSTTERRRGGGERGEMGMGMGTEEELDPEFTVRGRLHWVGVMREWGWEILLG